MASNVIPTLDEQLQDIIEFIVHEAHEHKEDFDYAQYAAPKCENSKRPVKFDPEGKPTLILQGIYNKDITGAPVIGSRKCPHCNALRFDYKASLDQLTTCPSCEGLYRW